jgi:hypothetical protein
MLFAGLYDTATLEGESSGGMSGTQKLHSTPRSAACVRDGCAFED